MALPQFCNTAGVFGLGLLRLAIDLLYSRALIGVDSFLKLVIKLANFLKLSLRKVAGTFSKRKLQFKVLKMTSVWRQRLDKDQRLGGVKEDALAWHTLGELPRKWRGHAQQF